MQCLLQHAAMYYLMLIVFVLRKGLGVSDTHQIYPKTRLYVTII